MGLGTIFHVAAQTAPAGSKRNVSVKAAKI